MLTLMGHFHVLCTDLQTMFRAKNLRDSFRPKEMPPWLKFLLDYFFFVEKIEILYIWTIARQRSL